MTLYRAYAADRIVFNERRRMRLLRFVAVTSSVFSDERLSKIENALHYQFSLKKGFFYRCVVGKRNLSCYFSRKVWKGPAF